LPESSFSFCLPGCRSASFIIRGIAWIAFLPKPQLQSQLKKPLIMSSSILILSLLHIVFVNAHQPAINIGARAVTTDPGLQACSFVDYALSFCNSASPGFSTFNPTYQAPCLCYSFGTSTTLWEPNIYDNAIETCATYASEQNDASLYTELLRNEGFCSSVGNLITQTAPASATAHTTSSESNPTITVWIPHFFFLLYKPTPSSCVPCGRMEERMLTLRKVKSSNRILLLHIRLSSSLNLQRRHLRQPRLLLRRLRPLLLQLHLPRLHNLRALIPSALSLLLQHILGAPKLRRRRPHMR
jgi:hypothetical protein